MVAESEINEGAGHYGSWVWKKDMKWTEYSRIAHM